MQVIQTFHHKTVLSDLCYLEALVYFILEKGIYA